MQPNTVVNDSLVRQPAQPTSSVFTSIDGLRGIACLMVLCHHCYFHGGRYSYPIIEIFNNKISLSGVFFYGYSGVELFFVLSGFCLAYSMIKNPDRKVDWRQYFLNRIRRIYPAFLASMALFMLLSLIINYFKITPLINDEILQMPSLKVLIYSFSFISLSFNTSFWTLCVEWRWYLILPIIILIYKRFKITGVFFVSIISSIIYSLYIEKSSNVQLAFFLSPLPKYLPLFSLGIWVAHIAIVKKNTLFQEICTRYVRLGCLASLVLIVILVPHEPQVDFSYERIVPFGIFYFFVLIAAIFDEKIKKILSWKPIVLIGNFSYSLYLIHLPIIQIIHSITKSMNWTPQFQFIFYQGLVMPTCIALSYVFYRVAEKPFIKKRSISI
jgi:peptidoglycan/LPS O-acetylase OafA/YrhL